MTAYRTVRLPFVLLAIACLWLMACSGGSDSPQPAASVSPEAVQSPESSTNGALIGRPQNRANIGNVQLALDRAEDSSRQDLTDLADRFKSQGWYKDGLTREESLFVERSLTFVSRYAGPRTAYVSQQTIEQKLIRYEKVDVRNGQVELLLIYEPNQRPDPQMSMIKRSIQVMEELTGVQYPAGVMTVVNGRFEINDFNESEFIRIARCCVLAPFILAHEVAHTYWSMAPSWFNEGMANVYATMVLERLNNDPPAGWQSFSTSLDAYYRQTKATVDRGRFRDMILSRRFTEDGLYEVATVFLLDIRNALGPDEFAKAAREIYLQSDFGRYVLRDKRIQDIFLQFAKGDARNEVMAQFNKHIWGDNGEKYQRLVEQEGE